MFELNEIKAFFHSIGVSDSDTRIEQLYKMIPNPAYRVNSHDKQWVACFQTYEKATAISAISEILYPNNALSQTMNNPDIEKAFNDVCGYFSSKSIVDKPRIPFYILMLNYLVPAL